MGEIADDMIDGLICQGCMQPFKEEKGYPCFCTKCQKEQGREDNDKL